MGEEDVRLQSQCSILIFLAVRGMPVESATALRFAELIFRCDKLCSHSPLLKILSSFLYYTVAI